MLDTIGSIASILSLFVSLLSWKVRVPIYLLRVISCGVFATVVYIANGYHQKIERMASVERAATQMVADKRMEYTDLGFVQATLAFLEKNKDLYPDTYERALKMCSNYKCNEPGNQLDMVDLSYTMSGLLKGLATIEREKK